MKEIMIAINDRSLTLELDVKDKVLLDAVFLSLRNYVTVGDPIKIRQTYMNSPSDSLRINTDIISDVKSLDRWKRELDQLISVLRSHT